MIKIENLAKIYGKSLVLSGVDMKIKENQRTTIIGTSGCGKSTLLRLILGLEGFQSGEIYVNEKGISKLSEAELDTIRLQFGVVFQSAALFDSMTVGENVGLVLKEHTNMTFMEIRRKVRDVLDLVGLAHTYKQMPSDLSGGMKKRVAFARAIIKDPKIILFDEPTTGLDPITSTNIENLIIKLTDYIQATSVIVTHQISTILNVSQRIYMIRDGEAFRTEGPKEIMQSKNKMVYNFVNGLVEKKS